MSCVVPARHASGLIGAVRPLSSVSVAPVAAFVKDLGMEGRLVTVRLKLFRQDQVVTALDFLNLSASAAATTQGASAVTANANAARHAIEEALADALPPDDERQP